jgi:hypothetical protein
MTRAMVLVPLAGILVSVAVPLVRYAQKQRDERIAIEVLTEVRAAQERFRTHSGGYATDTASLLEGCGSSRPAMDDRTLGRLSDSGYTLELRAAHGLTALPGRDCHGRSLTSDYYAAVAPVNVSRAAQQAFAAQARGDIFIFYDGIPPSESDIANRLATPLAERSRFTIP